jgi:ubiquinone/menaquinone biosynthesis C-methylase UbiE
MARLNKNFGEPRGNLGRLAGWIMARENVRANRLVVELLGIGAEDRVLEIGCGPGVALADAARRASRGLTVGVDPSDVMVAQAKRRCRTAIRAGRAEARCAPAAKLPFADGSFTCAFSVNALPHWPSARQGFAELRRVLRPGAHMVIALRKQREGGGMDPHAHGATKAEITALCETLGDLGFRDVGSKDHELGRETLVTIAAVVPQTTS